MSIFCSDYKQNLFFKGEICDPVCPNPILENFDPAGFLFSQAENGCSEGRWMSWFWPLTCIVAVLGVM